MNLISSFLRWRHERKLKKLLRKRAGLVAERRIMVACGTYYPVMINELGEVEEHLRQLGWTGAA